MQIFR